MPDSLPPVRIERTAVPAPDGLPLFTQHFQPPPETPVRAHVLFVHGFIDHQATHAPFFHQLVSRGYALTAYDGRGFGQTWADGWPERRTTRPGRFGFTSGPEQLADLLAVLTHLTTRIAPSLPLFLIGFVPLSSSYSFTKDGTDTVWVVDWS